MATIVPYKTGWRAVIRRVGYKTQTKTFALHGDAEKWARTIEHQMDAKTHISPTNTTAKKIFQRFSNEVSVDRPGCKWEQVRLARIMRTTPWMIKKVSDVDRFDIQQWRDDRLKEVSPSSVRRELNLISSVITHAMREWGISLRVNPVHEIVRPAEAKSRKRRITAAESLELEKSFKFDDKVPPRKGWGAVKDSVMWVFHLAKETGMRSGELLEAVWTDVHLDQHWLHVPRSKNGDERDVPLTERAEELLRVLGPGKGRVFPINKGSFEACWRLLRDAAGVKDLHMHDTRHEAASNLAKKLTHLELSKMLGHRDPRTVSIYYNPTPTELANKLRGVSEVAPAAPAQVSGQPETE